MAIPRGRSCIALALVVALLAGPAFAKTTVTTLGGDASRPLDALLYNATIAADDPPADRDGRILALSAGALAGAILGIALTSGLATPVGAAAMAAPGAAIAAREVVIYAARTVAVAITATIGGLLGGWVYQGR
jgi:hypothetical protein